MTKVATTPLGARLGVLCAEHGLTFTELATRLGIERTTLYHWRTGKRRRPQSVATLVALADAFGVSTDWLLGRTDRRRPA